VNYEIVLGSLSNRARALDVQMARLADARRDLEEQMTDIRQAAQQAGETVDRSGIAG
jgi:uncharacterized protein YigA (DUF484 family)